jgi:hypothetical protein
MQITKTSEIPAQYQPRTFFTSPTFSLTSGPLAVETQLTANKGKRSQLNQTKDKNKDRKK